MNPNHIAYSIQYFLVPQLFFHMLSITVFYSFINVVQLLMISKFSHSIALYTDEFAHIGIETSFNSRKLMKL